MPRKWTKEKPEPFQRYPTRFKKHQRHSEAHEEIYYEDIDNMLCTKQDLALKTAFNMLKGGWDE